MTLTLNMLIITIASLCWGVIFHCIARSARARQCAEVDDASRLMVKAMWVTGLIALLSAVGAYLHGR
jgi:hypothetical protein